MTKSELFKAAHAIAKAYKKESGCGDYAAYFSFALKKVAYGVSKIGKEKMFKKINQAVVRAGSDYFVTYKFKQNTMHGQLSFKKQYMLDKAEKQLEKGQFLGKRYYSNGEWKANVRSIQYVDVAY